MVMSIEGYFLPKDLTSTFQDLVRMKKGGEFNISVTSEGYHLLEMTSVTWKQHGFQNILENYN